MSGSLMNEFNKKTPRKLDGSSEDSFGIRSLRPNDINWPKQLAGSVHQFLDLIGDPTLVSGTSVAVFCSSQCPGDAILETMKWISELADDESRTVIGGFHSAMEKSFLEILLDGRCRLVVCPARSLERYRIPATFKARIAQGRLTIASSLRKSVRMNSATSSNHRNQLVASLAQQIAVTYASPESRT